MSKKVLFKGRKIESMQYLITRWSHRCPQCEKLFSSKFCLNRHLQIHSAEEEKKKKFECIVCKKRFHEIANYLRHCMFHDMKTHLSKGPANGYHNQRRQFDSSPETINELSNIKLREASSGNNFLDDSNEDDSVEEKPSEGKFSCGHCPRSYNNSLSLSRHVARVHKQGYKCRICGLVLSTIDNYLQHKNVHDKKNHKCQFCERTFANKKSCTIHERVHTGEKPYKCSTCERAFTQKSHLADHVRTHSGARPFACNQCNFAFTTHSSRRRHQRVVHRVGEKEVFPCDTCGAVLSTKYSITLHMKRHDAGLKKGTEKKYLCSICKSFFASSSSLRKHLRRMHNYQGRPNTFCTICNLSYYSEATLQQHLSRAHGVTVSHETIESISCDECGALMQTQSGILIHKRRCHAKSE